MLAQIGVDDGTNVYGIEKYPDGRLNGQFIARGTAQRVGITSTADMAFAQLGFEPDTPET